MFAFASLDFAGGRNCYMSQLFSADSLGRCTLQGKVRGRTADRREPGRGDGFRGQRAQVGQPPPAHGAAGQRRGRLPPLGRALRAGDARWRRDEALDLVRRLEERSRGEFVLPLFFAWVYIGLGDREVAFDWLEKACRQQSFRIHLLVDPIYDPIRPDPRFGDLLRRLGFNV
jgi:hypothetical protein